jgi:hypothetical protein
VTITVSLSREWAFIADIGHVRTRPLLAVLAVAGTLLATGCVAVGTGSPTGSPTAGSTTGSTAGSTADPVQARQQLDGLAVAPPLSMAGYSRDRFPHWIDQGNGCDTREVVLKRDGRDVRTNQSCHVTSGQWVSPYDGKAVTNANSLDIDHLVPLADAWRTGAKNWTDDKRSQFANDLTDPQLIAVSATTNRAKGDQDPSQWKPPNHGYWCTYAENWVAVKRHWQLTVTEAEKTALKDMLGTC